MRFETLSRAAGLALLLGGFACARNKTNDEVGAARDTTAVGASVDTAKDQTQSGVTDSSGRSTLGKGVEQTRPDQGQPVTSKGDTINPGVDSANGQQTTGTTSTRETTTDTSGASSSTDTSSMRSSMDSSTGQDTTGMGGRRSTDSISTSTDSSSTQR
jgi:hypothetical protein